MVAKGLAPREEPNDASKAKQECRPANNIQDESQNLEVVAFAESSHALLALVVMLN
jgi:hypothetical protein